MAQPGGRRLTDDEVRVLQRLVADRILSVGAVRECLDEFHGAGGEVPMIDLLERRTGLSRRDLERSVGAPEEWGGATQRVSLDDTDAWAVAVPERYEVERRWSRSAGLVLVRDRETGKPAILRLFPGSGDDAASSAFLRHARTLAALSHPGLPRILDLGQHGENGYAVREAFDSRDFLALLAEKTPLEKYLHVLADAAAAVDQLHQASEVHGDLRPENVHLRADGQVVVAEPTFGYHPALLHSGGASPYWAPEVLQTREYHREPTADVFSLGVLLYLALTRRVPYAGATREELLRSFLESTPSPPRRLDPEVDRLTEAICLHAIDVDARLRYPNAGEFARELHRRLEGSLASSVAQRPLPRPGDRLGHYSILEKLGEGGMGVIYLARHEGLARKVALKVLKQAGAKEHQRFLQEGRILAGLDHPNVIRVLDVGEVDGHVYLAMEYLSGLSLEERLSTGSPVAPEETMRLLVPVAEGLAHAHGKGILHRDLKPANVLFDEAGNPRLSDFGLAKGIEGASSLTSTGIILGTPYYMSPEAAAGERDLTAACDVYSFGAMLYRCLTGTVPHSGPSLADLLASVRRSDPIPVRALVPEVSPELERICLKAMAREPANRHPDGAALVEELRRVRSPRTESGDLARRIRAMVAHRRVLWVVVPALAAALAAILAWALFG